MLESVHDISVANSKLLLVDAEDEAELRSRVAHLTTLVREPELCALDDLAAALRCALADRPVRAAVVATSADQASQRLLRLAQQLDNNATTVHDVPGGVFAARVADRPSIGYLFPGQGSGRPSDGGALAGRFETVRELYRTVTIPEVDDPSSTEAAQPRIVASSVAGLRVMSELGIEASAAMGHSLGELTALHWAGAMDESTLLDLAATRGQIMADSSQGGAMAGIAAGPDQVEALLRSRPVVIAGYNGPAQTVISGPAEAVADVRSAAAAAGLKATRIPVSDAFHSPAMAPAAAGLDAYLAGLRFHALERRVLSTVTGEPLPPGTNLRELLVTQLCAPVRFSQVLERLADEVSLLAEVGPGRVLSGLAARICPRVPVVPLVTDGTSLSGVMCTAAAAYVRGVPVRLNSFQGDVDHDPTALYSAAGLSTARGDDPRSRTQAAGDPPTGNSGRPTRHGAAARQGQTDREATA